MNADTNKTDLSEERTGYAEDRTNYAEDRTAMANERTFAGWVRTGLAAVGIGIGFNALFGKLEPLWLPKLIASAFILAGIAVLYMAQRQGSRVLDRLNTHDAEPIKGVNMRFVAGTMGLAASALLVSIWIMDWQ